MELWQNLLWAGGALLLALVISLAPGRIGVILAFMGVNALAGLVVLTVINLCANFTQLFLPLNAVTVAVSSVLGAPGIVALAVLAAV